MSVISGTATQPTPRRRLTLDGGLPRKRAFILLRFGFIITAAYLLLAEVGFGAVSPVVATLIACGLISNLALLAVPDRYFETLALNATVIVADTAGITGAMLYTQGVNAEFFYVYFFVLFMATIGENVSLIALGAVVVAAGYLYSLSSGATDTIWSTSSLARVPFLFMVAGFYGYLVNRVRDEQRRTQETRRTVDHLEAVRGDLAQRARELQEASQRLESEVAERKLAEQELERANRKLERLSRTKSDFISTVSHELRTPLTSIKNSMDLLQSGRTGELSDKQARFVGLADRNTKRLTNIINDLLDLSKIEAGKLRFRFAATDVHELLEEVVESFRGTAEGSSIGLALDCPHELPQAWADRQRIDQVVSNLLSNALKFTPAGGRVEIAASEVEDGIEVRVTDTGPGLSPEEQDRIFERFYQVEDPLTRTKQGSGLGLSIVRRLLALHSSRISVDSEPGKGSTFFFTLPRSSPDAAEMCEFEESFQQTCSQAYFFSILVLRPRPAETESAEPAERSAGLERLRKMVRDNMPRASDLVLIQRVAGRVIVVLPSTSKGGAEVVKVRLSETLARAADGGSLAPTEILGPVGFPDDGSSGKELLAVATPAGRAP